MDNKILEGLDKEIERIQGRLGSVEPASQEYEYMVNQLNKLHGLRMKEIERDDEASAQAAAVERELMKNSEEADRTEKELVERAKDRKFDKIMRGVELGAPLMFYGAFMLLGFNFEKEGAICSTTFKNFIGKLKPTKK